MNELKLIEQAQRGDKKSLAELVKMYEQTVYNFSFKIKHHKHTHSLSQLQFFTTLFLQRTKSRTF